MILLSTLFVSVSYCDSVPVPESGWSLAGKGTSLKEESGRSLTSSSIPLAPPSNLLKTTQPSKLIAANSSVRGHYGSSGKEFLISFLAGFFLFLSLMALVTTITKCYFKTNYNALLGFDEEEEDATDDEDAKEDANFDGAFESVFGREESTRDCIHIAEDQHLMSFQTSYNSIQESIVSKDERQSNQKSQNLRSKNYSSASPLTNYSSASPLTNYSSASPLTNYSSASPLTNYSSASPPINNSASLLINSSLASPLINSSLRCTTVIASIHEQRPASSTQRVLSNERLLSSERPKAYQSIAKANTTNQTDESSGIRMGGATMISVGSTNFSASTKEVAPFSSSDGAKKKVTFKTLQVSLKSSKDGGVNNKTTYL